MQIFENNTSSVPSKEYELLRRRIYLNTKEFWYYINSELQSLEKQGMNVQNIHKIKMIVNDHYRSLLKDVSDLIEVDGYSIWREQESESLSNLVQKRLDELQNPSNCSLAKQLVCKLNIVRLLLFYRIYKILSNINLT